MLELWPTVRDWAVRQPATTWLLLAAAAGVLWIAAMASEGE